MFVKSCFNYIGGKYKLLPLLFKYFPSNINVFIDVFGGGFNVGVNSCSNKIIYNDQLTPLVELHNYLYCNNIDEILNYINNTIEEYNLTKTDKSTFNQFRLDYNSSNIKHPLDLYILICFSFNYQMRFNNNGEYNSSHGTNRSCFSKTTEKRLKEYVLLLQSKNVIFLNEDFTNINYNNLIESDFVYFDPPYILSNGNYNDGNRGFKNWSKYEEKQLYKSDIQFGLNNLLIHKNKINPYLNDFLSENPHLLVINMENNYNNSSYNKKIKNDVSKELYITNVVKEF